MPTLVTTNSDEASRGRSSATRDRLLTCAEGVFGERGTAGRLDDVAEAAGVAKSLVFRYWPRKEDLFEEVRLRAEERYRGWIEHARWSAGNDPIPAVAGAAAGFFDRPLHALFDPLVTRTEWATNAPELHALEVELRATVDRVASPEHRAASELLVDSLTLCTLRGWVGAPSIAGLELSTADIQMTLATMLRGGLDGLHAVPATGRRPRRPPRGPLLHPNTERERRQGELLDAALVVFADAGYAEARLEDIAAKAGTTASALFTYWAGKQELFIALRRAITARIAVRLLTAMAEADTVPGKLRAAVRANIAVHYENPEFQPVMLPVPTMPTEAELESVGWQQTMEQLQLFPDLLAAGELLPVATAIGLAALRGVVLTMHRHAIHPVIATALAEDFLHGAIAALTRELGVRYDA
jgi:AcrR family transcriptional regulator